MILALAGRSLRPAHPRCVRPRIRGRRAAAGHIAQHRAAAPQARRSVHGAAGCTACTGAHRLVAGAEGLDTAGAGTEELVWPQAVAQAPQGGLACLKRSWRSWAATLRIPADSMAPDRPHLLYRPLTGRLSHDIRSLSGRRTCGRCERSFVAQEGCVLMPGWEDGDRNNLPAPQYEDLPEQAQALIRFARLTPEQVDRVVALQHQNQISFARAATELGYLTPPGSDVGDVPAIQLSDPERAFLATSSHANWWSATSRSVHPRKRSVRSAPRSCRWRSRKASGPLPSRRRERAPAARSLPRNIALAFAQMAVPTLLVDANLRDPRIAQMFGLARNSEGLSHALRARNIDDVPIAARRHSGPVDPGRRHPSAQSAGIAVVGANFSRSPTISKRASASSIYDTAPAMEFADAAVVAARVGSAIIIARQHETSYDDIATLAGQIPRLTMQVPRHGDECVLILRNATTRRPASSSLKICRCRSTAASGRRRRPCAKRLDRVGDLSGQRAISRAATRLLDGIAIYRHPLPFEARGKFAFLFEYRRMRCSTRDGCC